MVARRFGGETGRCPISKHFLIEALFQVLLEKAEELAPMVFFIRQ